MSRTDPLISKIDLRRAARWPALKGLTLLALGTRHDPAGATFGPRLQWSWELVWIRSGVVRQTVDGERTRLVAGDVALVAPGVTDSYEWLGKGRVVHSFVHFNFKGAIGWLPPSRWPRHFPLGQRHFVHQALDVLTSLPANSPELFTIVGEPLLEVTLRVLLAGTSFAASPRTGLPDCVERALDWMQSHVTASFTLGDLAHAAHVAPSYLCRSFREHLDLSPMECSRLLRLERAIGYLEQSDAAMKEIAELTGFSNGFHFSRCFSEAFGMCPSGYREDARRGIVHRLVSPALERLAAQRIVMNEPSMSLAQSRSRKPHHSLTRPRR